MCSYDYILISLLNQRKKESYEKKKEITQLNAFPINLTTLDRDLPNDLF